MSFLKSKLTAPGFIALVLIFTAQPATLRAQRVSERPLRVLVDASKDGGLWWFPQRPPTFDPKQHHQGKFLADFMREQGWEVVELPRGEVITFDRLRDTDVVIRPPAYFPYTLDEAVAYRDSVNAGTRLLLLGGNSTSGDAVAEIFGVRFEPRSRFSSVKQWVPHSLTAKMECCNLVWTGITEAPNDAVLLAWLIRSEINPRPVLGYLTFGSGYVVFAGQTLMSQSLRGSFSGNLIKAVGRYTMEEIRRLPRSGLVIADETAGGLAPRLIEPISDATLPQPDTIEWRFDWEDVPAAEYYEIVILGATSAFPTEEITNASEYVLPVNKFGYIADPNLQGWTWRVRAVYHNGKRGPWSAARRFNVYPRKK